MVTKRMNINDSNTMEGNNAVASVLLLYYHLATKGCFCGDETVYIDRKVFDGYRYLDVVVAEAHNLEINEKFLREAAVIFILCDLNDMITEHEESFHYFDVTKKIIAAFKEGRLSAIPEVVPIVKLLESDEANFNYSAYSDNLRIIFE